MVETQFPDWSVFPDLRKRVHETMQEWITDIMQHWHGLREISIGPEYRERDTGVAL